MCPAAIRAVPAINGGRAESSATHPVIARSTLRALASRREATRQSVLPYPEGRIPTPVTRPLARNDSAALPRWRDVGDTVPYGRFAAPIRRAGPMCPAAIRAAPVINGGRAESSATHPVIARSTLRALASRREATRQSVLPYPKGRIPTPVTSVTGSEWQRGAAALAGRRGRRPLRNDKGRRDALCAHYKTSGCFCWTWTAPSIWMTGCLTA